MFLAVERGEALGEPRRQSLVEACGDAAGVELLVGGVGPLDPLVDVEPASLAHDHPPDQGGDDPPLLGYRERLPGLAR